MADENNTGDEQFTPDGSMEPLSPQEADTTDYGLMDTGERIQRKDLQQEMRESYLAYALSVIVERALPDVRDGMKPVHRRVIYAMYDGGYRPDRGYNKCSRVVGDVMGKYHPHGDSAIYDTLVRMAQSWSMRNMLVDGQGNFGSPGDDPAAAMRYTECRMAPLAMEMVRDIDKDTVDFVPNYDGKTQEPTVLPARFPNLLVNGSAGIAVGMATNIPPHNMREVADGVHWALDHPDASREELLENLIRIIKGPDFPTGATILGHKGIEQAYRTGRGLITMRAVVNTEEINGRMCLVVTELPYQVNPDRLVVSIREAVRDGKIQGIADMRDETSGRTGQRLVLVLKRDAVPKVVLNNLYKHSQLQQTFGANMLALVDGVPRTLSLDAFIRHWVNHQLDVIARRTAYLKREAEERDHILQGYLKALDMLDEVIALIKAYQPDLVMNIALPYQDLTIMDACLACGVNYMDTANYEPENTDDPEWRAIYEKRCKEAGFSAYFDYSWQWAYAKKFEEAGLTALLGSGFDPGVTQAYCAYAKKHEFDTIDTIDILDCNGGDHGYAFATNFNPEINLREVSAPGSYWENGHWVEIPAMSIKREYNFDQVGDKDMYLLHHEEIESLAKNIPEAKRIRFFMTFGQSYLDHMRCLEDVGMLSTTPVNFNGQEIVPIQFLKALLPDPASLGPRTKGKTNIGCIFTGKKDGKDKTYYIYNVCDHQECYKEVGSQAISYTTGVPAMCGALMLLTGKWTTKGVHTVEEFDPDPYLDALDKYGLPRSESHNPALVD